MKHKELKIFIFALLGLILILPAGISGMTVSSAAWSRDINAGGYLDGTPVGGFGAGTITMRFDGDFYKGRLKISSNDMTTDPNCHFYMYQKPTGQNSIFKKLNAATLGSGQATYYALFPFSWVRYTGNIFPCKATMKQFSPIIPNDYQRSSYPVAIYEWEITNPNATACDASVMLTWNNNFNGASAVAVSTGNNRGITLKRSGNDDATTDGQGEFTLASTINSEVTVSYESAANIGVLETDFSGSGSLKNTVGANTIGGISFKTTVGANQTITVPIVLAWDIPLAAPNGTSSGGYWREYTRYFGRSGLNSWNIANEALNNYTAWETAITNWQNTILQDNRYPAWLQTTLFNELYYYFTGGVYWEAGSPNFLCDPNEDMFAQAECYGYPCYETNDVRFYSSWPLLMYWPNIEKQCIRQLSDSVWNNNPYRPTRGNGAAEHDFGDFSTVFRQFRYVNWRDINTKFILQVYRDWALTGKTDMTFLNYCIKSMQIAMQVVKNQDTDGDGLPDSDGIDTTYDQMNMYGDTAYTGGLMLAADEAMVEMENALGDTINAAMYQSWFNNGQANYEKKLWNGSYYNMDTASSTPNRTMADMLCGQWYAKACGLPDIISHDHAVSALNRLYNYNFKKFNSGLNGVINVMSPDGTYLSTGYESECWIGVAWGVAAEMYQEGLTSQAFDVGYSLYNTIYNTAQYWFRTPEAWEANPSECRANYYMRANTVWALKRAIDLSGSSPSSPTPTVTPTPTPPPAGKVIPGKIEAESYDAMFDIQTEACSEGTQDVGWIEAGSWMDYNVTVQTGGSYTVNFRVTSPYDNTQFQIIQGTTALATVTSPNTGGWQNWATVTATVNLTAGAQTLRILALTNGWNINWLSFTLNGSTPTPPPGSLAKTWYLFNQAVSGVTPAGQNLQATTNTITGWQPTTTITSTPKYWYSPALSGTYNAGNWFFTLWSNNPGSSSTVEVDLYKVNADGSGPALLKSQTSEAGTSGGGNHATTFTFSNLAAVSLNNQRLMVKITKSSGADLTMAYNTNDFPTSLSPP